MKKITLTAALIAGTIMATPAVAQSEIAGLDWSGRVNFGGFVTDGNTDKKAIVLDGQGKARGEKNRYTAGAEVRYAEDNGVETENEYMIFGEYDRFITDKWFTGGRMSFESDDIANLDSRFRVGPYVGYQFYESDPLNLSTRIGLDYIADEFSNGDSSEDIAATWGVKYDQRFFKDAVQAFYNHDLSTPVDDTSGFLFDSSAGIRFPIANVLTGTAQVDFDWDNDPADGIKEDDTKYSLKLGYEF